MLRSDPKLCPYCQVKLPSRFKPNMCLSKIINEFEVPCPLECGIRIKKGELQQHVDKYCPEKLYECAECGKQMKKDIFKYHISREH